MRIVVFGAAGGVGQEVIAQGLAAGYSMTAFVRNAQALPTRHAHPT